MSNPQICHDLISYWGWVGVLQKLNLTDMGRVGVQNVPNLTNIIYVQPHIVMSNSVSNSVSQWLAWPIGVDFNKSWFWKHSMSFGVGWDRSSDVFSTQFSTFRWHNCSRKRWFRGHSVLYRGPSTLHSEWVPLELTIHINLLRIYNKISHVSRGKVIFSGMAHIKCFRTTEDWSQILFG